MSTNLTNKFFDKVIFPSSGTHIVNFSPPDANEVQTKQEVPVKTLYQSTTRMKEYDDKSTEELRLEDYKDKLQEPTEQPQEIDEVLDKSIKTFLFGNVDQTTSPSTSFSKPVSTIKPTNNPTSTSNSKQENSNTTPPAPTSGLRTATSFDLSSDSTPTLLFGIPPAPTSGSTTATSFGSSTAPTSGSTSATSFDSLTASTSCLTATPSFSPLRSGGIRSQPPVTFNNNSQSANNARGFSCVTNRTIPSQQSSSFNQTFNLNNTSSGFSTNPFPTPSAQSAYGILLWSVPRSFSTVAKNVKTWCVTNTFVKKDSFVWSIDNFKFRSEIQGECIKSSTFISGYGSKYENKWRLDIYPNGYLDSDDDFIALKVNLLDNKCPTDVRVTMGISILNSFSNVVCVLDDKSMSVTIPDTGVIYCHNFLKKQDLFNNHNSLLPYGSLTIIFDIGTMTGTSTKSKKTKQINLPKDQIRNELFKYYQSDKFSDVIIEVDGSELKAHKIILSTHSPIFAAMFDDESMNQQENNKTRIKIDNMKLDVAKQLLEFIYTNKKPSKINELTNELIIAAQKYQIDGLKIMCEEILFDTISVDNVIKILLIAHEHDNKKLKDFVIEFIKNHGSVVRSNEFKDLEKERPALTMEIYHAIVLEKVDN